MTFTEDLFILDYIGHVGYLLLFVGMYAITNKQVWGWPIRLGGEALWVYLGWVMGMTSIWFWCGLFFILEAGGWYKWSKEKKK